MFFQETNLMRVTALPGSIHLCIAQSFYRTLALGRELAKHDCFEMRFGRNSELGNLRLTWGNEDVFEGKAVLTPHRMTSFTVRRKPQKCST